MAMFSRSFWTFYGQENSSSQNIFQCFKSNLNLISIKSNEQPFNHKISKFRHVIDETVDKVSIEVREWLTTNLKAIEKFLLEQCENGLAKASLVAYFHKSSHQYETRVSDDDTINWPITSMGRSNNIWLDIVCHIISREWGIFATWTSFDSSSFQIDFHLTSTALSDPREINSPVYALLKSWERSYSRGPGLYVYKSWY